MAAPRTTLTDETRLVIANLADRTAGVVTPNVRLGVTGLARAGKTVFIAALVHNLIHGGRLPMFKAYAAGRVGGARLAPQPDDAVPRFDYEGHVRALVDQRVWPGSTDRVSELRVTVNYESARFMSRLIGSGKFHIDIVDYPGEWLLDLPLLGKDYAAWSADAIAAAGMPARRKHAALFLARVTSRPAGEDDETTARELARLYTQYLFACRADTTSLSTQPPGRFVMPGDLDRSPALTFAPLPVGKDGTADGPLARMMARRYEAYKATVVRPFFRDHFARLDRQIVLVDALAALNAGSAAMAELEAALASILSSFRLGRTNWLTGFVTRRIDRILFAATKADHLHHRDHDRLEAILRLVVDRAVKTAHVARARVEVLAMASVRATREASVTRHGETLPAIIGTPVPGEAVAGRTFDGATETAVFPGDLPDDPARAFAPDNGIDVRFVRFRPPRLERTAEGLTLSLPHIRLDRALEFLFGDRLQMTRKPAAFDLGEVRYEPEDLYPEEAAASVPGITGPVRKRRWLTLLVAAVGGLIVLALGLAVDALVRGLFERGPAFGWIAVALAALAVLALVAIVWREVVALLRLRRITHLHERAFEAARTDDRAAAMAVVAELTGLYRRRAETARGRAELARHRGEIIDGRDLIGLAETQLLLPFDQTAKRLILDSSKRVALVTAVAPRAILDIGFVGIEVLRLIRRLALLYDGRPGTLGFIRLARATFTHLAVTGGIAMGDSIIQQILGTGIAARVSARLGEGFVNGLLTARVGIAAVDVCRPLPFVAGSPPRLADVIAALRSTAKDAE